MIQRSLIQTPPGAIFDEIYFVLCNLFGFGFSFGFSFWSRLTGSNLLNNKESPPAWTQEAYCLLCSKYSLCCPNWVLPHPDLAGGVTYLVPPGRVPPGRVPLQQGIPPAGYSPAWYPSGRVPPTGPGRVSPHWTWQCTPPTGVCPMAFWEMLQSIMGYGYPPGVNKLTKWNYYLPVVLSTRVVIIEVFTNSLQYKQFTAKYLTLKCNTLVPRDV